MKSRLKPWCWWAGVSLVMGFACSSSVNDDERRTQGGSSGQASSGEASSAQAGESGAGSGAIENQGGGGAAQTSVSFEHTCKKPVTDPVTGLVTCEEGYQHRPKPVTCGAPAEVGGAGGSLGSGGDGTLRLPRAPDGVLCEPAAGGAGGRTGSGDCEAYEHGFCKWYDDDGAGGAIGLCRSGCADDAECGSGFVCICDERDSPTGGRCKPANCATDDDCGAGLLCASYQAHGCNLDGFACQLPNDECQSSADCEGATCNWRQDRQRHFCDRAQCLN